METEYIGIKGDTREPERTQIISNNDMKQFNAANGEHILLNITCSSPQIVPPYVEVFCAYNVNSPLDAIIYELELFERCATRQYESKDQQEDLKKEYEALHSPNEIGGTIDLCDYPIANRCAKEDIEKLFCAIRKKIESQIRNN